MNYSVLMSVYYKEKPEFLNEAMNSIWNQTVKPNDFVLVCDGALTKELELVIEEMLQNHKELNVIRLSENGGLGKALNTGIKHCKNELVARMDSDDISRPDRCERQLKVFEKKPDFSICSGTVEEFTEDKNVINSRRVLPETSSEIKEFARKRNPFNHPCVMYKKKEVEKAGGYKDFYLLEDYYLWVRMLKAGCSGYNIQEPLLWMRAGSDMYKRRSGLKYGISQVKLFWYMRQTGFIGNIAFMKSAVQRIIVSLIPNWMRQKLFTILLRNKQKNF
ncbi:glycosyltransferase [Oribacterium sp. FC2011]|uniref:glycosyltransferase n=1 Tax=Oribacterium sp. FC2011 TaxID=1408311 RepID=UPI0004E1D2B0|nr:glycosyltransferase [Oribacterium sp. FC2011]